MRHTIYEKVISAVSKYKKNKIVSTLTQDGKLTLEEFVIAGDSLISICPNWSWATADASKRIKGLPDDKQFLINRGVVCEMRAQDLCNELGDEIDIGDGWCQACERQIEEAVDLDSSDDVVDIDDIDIDGIEAESDSACNEAESNENVRTYNISIVYDKYFNVPRVFLTGVNAAGQPLSKEEMEQDISCEHVGQTVTFEDHHMINMKCLSIHPCKHAHVMKGLIDRTANPEEFCAPLYFFTFLKFIHTVIPTIDISTPTIELNN